MDKIFHEKIISWFNNQFNRPSAVQIQAWQVIEKQRDVLISSPTGSGKTLAAFLYGLNQLFVKGDDGLFVVLGGNDGGDAGEFTHFALDGVDAMSAGNVGDVVSNGGHGLLL